MNTKHSTNENVDNDYCLGILAVKELT